MLSKVPKRLNSLAWLVLPLALLHATAISAQASEPIARIYDGDKLVGEVLKYGQELGDGEYGIVQKVLIRTPQGDTHEVALKRFKEKATLTTIQKIMLRWATLDPVYRDDHQNVLTHGMAGLKLVPSNPNGHEASSDVIMTSLADGSVQSIWPKIQPNPALVRRPGFEARLDLVLKYQREILSGITLLTANGLVHGDIKPANVLYTAKPDLDWKSPDSSKIHFALADFDSITPVGEPPSFTTRNYAPPERIALKSHEASAAADLYSHALSVYKLIFISLPFENYFDATHGDSKPGKFDEEKAMTYVSPKRYAKYLEYVDGQFKDLESRVTSESTLQKLREIHAFVLNGLKFSPKERLNSFPAIEAGSKRYLAAQKGCKSLLPRLKALLH